MPDFRLEVQTVGFGDNVDDPTPGTPESRVWDDPASASRGSRITNVGNRVPRYLRVVTNRRIRINAIRTGESAPQDDTVAQFTSWAVEFPNGTPPARIADPVPGSSSIIEWVLTRKGHYAIAVRHEGSGGSDNVNGGAVLLHIDATDT